MQVSRAWRDIRARIQAGCGHMAGSEVTPGALAVFCPACPQPGINLPKDWEKDEQRWVIHYIHYFFTNSLYLSWLYTRSIVIDGNFAADHLKMKRPENDIPLTPGGRYMVEPVRYETHLREAIDYREVSFPFNG